MSSITLRIKLMRLETWICSRVNRWWQKHCLARSRHLHEQLTGSSDQSHEKTLLLKEVNYTLWAVHFKVVLLDILETFSKEKGFQIYTTSYGKPINQKTTAFLPFLIYLTTTSFRTVPTGRRVATTRCLPWEHQGRVAGTVVATSNLNLRWNRFTHVERSHSVGPGVEGRGWFSTWGSKWSGDVWSTWR